MKPVFAVVKRVFARYLLVSVFALILAGCSQPTKPPPKDAIKSLVYGPVESAFLEPLKGSLSQVRYDGSQKLEDFDLVILDGDHHTPAALQDDALVQEALRTGKWVLALDMTAEHKREGLGQVLLAATDGTSPAYAAHLDQDARGRPEVRVVEYPSPVEPVKALRPAAARSGLGGGLENELVGGVPVDPFYAVSPAPQSIDSSAAAAFADVLLDRLTTPAQLKVQALPPNIPGDLIYASFYYSTPVSWTVSGGGRGATGSQHPNFTANYTFTVFLNNRDNPQGDFQFVLLEADVTASPKTTTEDYVAARQHSSTNWSVDWDEWGWFQTFWTVGITPAPFANADDRLVTHSTSPDNQNHATTSTTAVNFSIGYNEAQGGNATFGYSTSTTRTITDWQVTNQSADNVASWYYRTQYPLDNDLDPLENNAFSCTQEIYRSCYIRMDPNDISMNSLSLDTQTVWSTADQNGTPTLVDGWAGFGVSSEHGMIDLFCDNNAGVFCSKPAYQSLTLPITKTYNINLGAIIPIPIASLTFSPNPAKGGTTVTGTVTLSKPAQMATPISLSSNSQNATVLPQVTVKQGETSATFQVLTNANGIAKGGRTVATISAFYAQDFQAQLTITK